MARELEKARRKDPKAVLFPESIVNFMGYEHLQSGDIRGALEIMKLNAAACPSANAYDSLSDAYLADGQSELTRQNARKALELLVSDTVTHDRAVTQSETTLNSSLRNWAKGNVEMGTRRSYARLPVVPWKTDAEIRGYRSVTQSQSRGPTSGWR